MADGQGNPRIEVEAARMAVQWKNLFATELKSAAQQLANGSDLVTADHYRQAIWEEIAGRLLPIDGDAAWSREKDARRLQLIDKKIQQTITPKEAIELTRLTKQMRVHCTLIEDPGEQIEHLLQILSGR